MPSSCQPQCQAPSWRPHRPPSQPPCQTPCRATNGHGDSRSRIQGDSFDWSRWNSMCSPKKLSGIVFLPHQSQLKYVNRFLCNMCRCGIQCAIPKRCQKSCSSPHSSHHSYNMLKRFLSTMCRCRILCDIPKRLQK